MGQGSSGAWSPGWTGALRKAGGRRLHWSLLAGQPGNPGTVATPGQRPHSQEGAQGPAPASRPGHRDPDATQQGGCGRCPQAALPALEDVQTPQRHESTALSGVAIMLKQRSGASATKDQGVGRPQEARNRTPGSWSSLRPASRKALRPPGTPQLTVEHSGCSGPTRQPAPALPTPPQGDPPQSLA